MTYEQALQVFSVKHKLDGYYLNQTLSLTPAEVGMLENIASANGYARTNWWCGSCAVGRLQEMMSAAMDVKTKHDVG